LLLKNFIFFDDNFFMLKKFKDNIEPYNRYCPICGEEIKKGTFSHKCDNNKLKELEIEDLNKEKELIEDRTFDEKLGEREYFLNFHDEEEDY